MEFCMKEHKRIIDEVPSTIDGMILYRDLAENKIKDYKLKINRLKRCLREVSKRLANAYL